MSVINVSEYLESLEVKSDSKLVSAVIDDLLNILLPFLFINFLYSTTLLLKFVS